MVGYKETIFLLDWPLNYFYFCISDFRYDLNNGQAVVTGAHSVSASAAHARMIAGKLPTYASANIPDVQQYNAY